MRSVDRIRLAGADRGRLRHSRGMRLIVGTAAAAALAAAALAHAAPPAARVAVSPSTGAPATTFEVGFRAPSATGVAGSVQRHDVVAGSVAGGRRGCVASFSVRAPDAPTGEMVRTALAPARLGGRWCAGRWSGTVTELQTPVCRAGQACPQIIVLLGVVGRFSFAVRG
jgi:hypothetical protein